MMNKLLGYGGVMLLAAGVLLPGPAKADIIYQDSLPVPSLQSITGSIGMDFTVNQSIQVTALGAFDNGVNANLAGTQGFGVEVGIFNDSTTALVGPSVLFNASGSYTQINADAFQSVSPFVLGPGTYSIVSWDDNNYNIQGGPSNMFQQLDNLNGAFRSSAVAALEHWLLRFRLQSMSSMYPIHMMRERSWQPSPSPQVSCFSVALY